MNNICDFHFDQYNVCYRIGTHFYTTFPSFRLSYDPEFKGVFIRCDDHVFFEGSYRDIEEIDENTFIIYQVMDE